jgi:hypothetical protein
MTKLDAKKLLISFLKSKKYKTEQNPAYKGMCVLYNQIKKDQIPLPTDLCVPTEVAKFFFEDSYIIDKGRPLSGININGCGLGMSVTRKGIPFVVDLIRNS